MLPGGWQEIRIRSDAQSPWRSFQRWGPEDAAGASLASRRTTAACGWSRAWTRIPCGCWRSISRPAIPASSRKTRTMTWAELWSTPAPTNCRPSVSCAPRRNGRSSMNRFDPISRLLLSCTILNLRWSAAISTAASGSSHMLRRCIAGTLRLSPRHQNRGISVRRLSGIVGLHACKDAAGRIEGSRRAHATRLSEYAGWRVHERADGASGPRRSVGARYVGLQSARPDAGKPRLWRAANQLSRVHRIWKGALERRAIASGARRCTTIFSTRRSGPSTMATPIRSASASWVAAMAATRCWPLSPSRPPSFRAVWTSWGLPTCSPSCELFRRIGRR